MSSQPDVDRIGVPWMTANRKRGLSLFLAGSSIFWLLVFIFALITMQLSPPQPALWQNLSVVALGLVGSGLFGWCSLAVRRADAYLEGTTLYVRSSFWFGYRSADLARVSRVRISEDKRDGGYDILLSGDGNLKRFPLAHPAPVCFRYRARSVSPTRWRRIRTKRWSARR